MKMYDLTLKRRKRKKKTYGDLALFINVLSSIVILISNWNSLLPNNLSHAWDSPKKIIHRILFERPPHLVNKTSYWRRRSWLLIFPSCESNRLCSGRALWVLPAWINSSFSRALNIIHAWIYVCECRSCKDEMHLGAMFSATDTR